MGLNGCWQIRTWEEIAMPQLIPASFKPMSGMTHSCPCSLPAMLKGHPEKLSLSALSAAMCKVPRAPLGEPSAVGVVRRKGLQRSKGRKGRAARCQGFELHHVTECNRHDSPREPFISEVLKFCVQVQNNEDIRNANEMF